MIVGLDFDNTIACYDGLFHTLALGRGLIPDDTPADKTQVRDFLRRQGKEDAWTELQGLAYGPSIVDATPFPGAVETIAELAENGCKLHIVSHKTKTPYRGEPHDLHAAARSFLDHHGVSPQLIPADRVHLCLTKADKLRRIADLRCTHFLDDLPEFLAEPAFPGATTKILFDPGGRHAEQSNTLRITAWPQLIDQLLDR
ncbi:MAG: haloacid dehalogenase-like hydrolase [Planctomycetota bacterium]